MSSTRFGRSAESALGLSSARGVVRATLCSFTLLLAFPVGAQSDDAAAAEALFVQARKLYEEGRVSEACTKFAESQRLDSSAGTLLNLARCHEAEGKTASAWSGYLSAKRVAAANGREAMSEEAASKAKALEPRLSFLSVIVTDKMPEMVIRRDGEPVNRAVYGSELPVDPGSYTLTASAPGYDDWSTEVVIGAGAHVETTVPSLTRAVPVEAVAVPLVKEEPLQKEEPATDPSDEGSTSKAPVAAYVVGGAGIAVAGLGLIFGGMANGAYSSAMEECPERVGCGSDAMNSRSRASTYATLSTVTVSLGLAGVASGIFLLVMHEPDEDPHAGVRADVSWVPGGGFAQMRGSF